MVKIHVTASQMSANDTLLRVPQEVAIMPVELLLLEESAFDLWSSMLTRSFPMCNGLTCP